MSCLALAMLGMPARAQTSAPARPLVRPRPQASGPTQPGTASFLGNLTTIDDPAGAMFLIREADCSLSLVSGNYSAGSAITYSGTAITGSFERTLHAEAGLTTTPGLFPSGCKSPATGIESTLIGFVGTTTSGVNVLAVAAYNQATQGQALYLISGTEPATYSATPFSFASAGAINIADLNKDGNGDIVVLNSTLTTAGSISVLLGNPDGSFKTAVNYPTAGAGAQTAVIDDFNGDGKLDLAVVSTYLVSNGTATSQQVSILLGNGDGTFQAAQNFTLPALSGYTSGQAPVNNVISASLRGNGKKDLIFSNGLVYLGNGDGTFTATSTPPLPFFTDNSSSGPYLSSGDLNNDGKADVVLSNGSSVNIFLGNGDGTFKAGASYASISDLYSEGYVTITDLDGDGNADIWVGMANGGLFFGDTYGPNQAYALMGNGDGTFQGAPITTAGPSTGAYTGTNLGDVNGDSVPDLIAASNSSSNTPTLPFTVVLGNGKGVFTPKSTITPPATLVLNAGNTLTGLSTSSPDTYAVADLNGDGKADLVFTESNLAYTYTPGTSFFRYNGASILFVSLSNGDGTFKTPVAYTIPQIAPAAGYDSTLALSHVQIADFNKDGNNDLIFSLNQTGSTGTVSEAIQGYLVLLGNGDGTFSSKPLVTSTSTAPSNTTLVPYVVSTADLNGDGVPDLLTLNPSFAIVNGFGVTSRQLETYIGVGDGTFKAPVPFAGASLVLTALVADFNKDRKPDLVFINAPDAVSQGNLEIALGNGDGTFRTPTTNLSISSGGSLAAADFNGDGNLDLALLGEINGVFYGNGDGTLTSINSSGTYGPVDLINIGAGSPAIALDLNKDGKPDILAGSTSLLNIYGSAPGTLGLGSLTGTTVKIAESATTIPAGTSVTFTATITPASGATATPTGTITFINGDVHLGTGTVASNKATLTTAALAPGTYNVFAVYEGDSNFAGFYSTPVTLTVTASTAVATTTTLTASTASAVSGTGITFTATVTPASGTASPTGAVNFLDGTTILGSGTLTAGVATFTTSTLAIGSHSITAAYQGASGTFNASTSTPAISITITAPVVATTTTLAASATSAISGASITFTATVSPASGTTAPTGTVNFLDGTSLIGTGTLDGTGKTTFTDSTLAVGSHSITAAYLGATGTAIIFSASTSSVLTETITAPPVPSFTIALSSTASTIAAPGGSATTTLTVSPTNGFNAATALTCTGSLTAGENCTIAPTSVTPNGSAASTATVTLQTSAVTGSLAHHRETFSLAATLPFGLFTGGALLAFLNRRFRRRALQFFALGIVAALLTATGCGKSSPAAASTPQTVNLTITATSGTITQSTPWTVTIQ